MSSEIKIGNLQAIIYHLDQGEDNGGVSRQALAEFLKGVKQELALLEIKKLTLEIQQEFGLIIHQHRS